MGFPVALVVVDWLSEIVWFLLEGLFELLFDACTCGLWSDRGDDFKGRKRRKGVT